MRGADGKLIRRFGTKVEPEGGNARIDGRSGVGGSSPVRLAKHVAASCHWSLAGVGSRAMIAGRLPNTPANLQRWIENPPALAPGTDMPELGVTAADARDMAAYLRMLK